MWMEGDATIYVDKDDVDNFLLAGRDFKMLEVEGARDLPRQTDPYCEGAQGEFMTF